MFVYITGMSTSLPCLHAVSGPIAQCVSASSKKHNICHCILRRSIRACWNALLYSQVILDADYTDCNTSLVLMIDIKKSASHSVVVDTSRFGQGKQASLVWVQLWSASPSLLMYLMVPNSIFSGNLNLLIEMGCGITCVPSSFKFSRYMFFRRLTTLHKAALGNIMVRLLTHLRWSLVNLIKPARNLLAFQGLCVFRKCISWQSKYS